MDIAIAIHGPLEAKAGHTNQTNHWVQISRRGADEYSDVTLFVPSYTCAEKIAAAINEAFTPVEREPQNIASVAENISEPGALR